MKGADLLKFILSLVVVWIHTGTSELYGLVNVAVPIFFALSGFFLFGKSAGEKHDCATVQNYLFKTLQLYLLWTFIYLPFAVIGFRMEATPLLKASAIWLRNVAFVGENYLSWPLWYLLGLLQAGLIIWMCEKLHLPQWGYLLLAALLYGLPYLIPLNQISWYTFIFKSTRNGLFIGFPYMVLGGAIRYLFPAIQGWKKDNPWYKPAIALRFFSIHVYLTHMLFAGALMLTCSPTKGLLLWGVTVLLTLGFGVVLWLIPSAQKALYGRMYAVSR